MKPYVPCVIYFPDADVLEYASRDGGCFYENIDADFAVVRDMLTSEIIGFRLSRYSKLKFPKNEE